MGNLYWRRLRFVDSWGISTVVGNTKCPSGSLESTSIKSQNLVCLVVQAQKDKAIDLTNSKSQFHDGQGDRAIAKRANPTSSARKSQTIASFGNTRSQPTNAVAKVCLNQVTVITNQTQVFSTRTSPRGYQNRSLHVQVGFLDAKGRRGRRSSMRIRFLVMQSIVA